MKGLSNGMKIYLAGNWWRPKGEERERVNWMLQEFGNFRRLVTFYYPEPIYDIVKEILKLREEEK